MYPFLEHSISVAGIDLGVIAIYLVGIVLVGVVLTKLASRNMESYFLGGREVPWWLLGLSGAASYVNIIGVMWTIAFFYTMGPRFFCIQWEWWLLAAACFAMLVGVAAAIVAVVWFADARSYISFLVLLAVSIASIIVSSLLMKPAGMKTLKEFYRRVHPPGFWRPVKRSVAAEQNFEFKDSFAQNLVAAIIIGIGLQSLFLSSVYACTQQWTTFTCSLIVVGASSLISYWTWCCILPSAKECEECVAKDSLGG